MFDRQVRRGSCVIVAVLLLLATGVVRAEPKEDGRWYRLDLAGSRAGYQHDRTTVAEDGTITSRSDITMSIARGPLEITIEMSTSFVEAADGTPVRATARQNMSQNIIETVCTWTPDHIVYVSTQGGRTITKEEPLPEGEWLTPRLARAYFLKRREGGAKEITYRVIDLQNGLSPFAIRHTYVKDDVFDLDGREVPVTVWSTESELMAGTTATEMYSADGVLVHSITTLPLGTMEARLVTEADALQKADKAPELMVSTFVRPSRAIERPLKATTATYVLRVTDGALPDLPSAGAQRVSPREDGALVLTVDVNDMQRASGEDEANEAYRESSAMANTEDPQIVKLAARGVRKAKDDSPLAKAEALRAFVHRYINKKDLGTAFASASETAQTRSGDCSEHGVLLCALLRAQGIPSRVASGLVYADAFAGSESIFGWHMWTQALVDGRWVDLDATLPVNYTAGHILTGTSSLDE
ncbi:MAG: transglutaminase domain-containing protein, partial [Phycisphaerales bacterium]|nr:transglutaminase domain-containing protein [Phycisphaerales bacterium]